MTRFLSSSGILINIDLIIAYDFEWDHIYIEGVMADVNFAEKLKSCGKVN